MPTEIKRQNLLSRATKIAVTQGKPRLIDLTNRLAQQQTGGNAIVQAINWIFNQGGRLVGFVSNVVGSILSRINFTTVFRWIVSAATVIVNFDWNATDASLKAQMHARNRAIAASWGGTIGGALGWTASIALGSGIAMLVPVIGGSTLARLVATEGAAEALPEILSLLKNSLRLTAQNLGANAASVAYINFRKMVKSAPLGLLRRFFGDQAAAYIKDKWGAEGQPSFTIAGAIDNAISNLPGGDLVQAFFEEAWEEFWDAFVEGGFIVAGTLDEAMAEAKAGAKQAMGHDETVLVIPNKETPTEAYAITGKRELLKEEIQSVIHGYRNTYNKDIGQIVGLPAQDWYRAQPHRRKITIIFKDKEKPPWRHPNGGGCKTATYTIPEAKAGLSWSQIKGAASTYDWGKFRATANLKSGRQMAVYGASAREAEKKLKQLLQLSTDEIVSLTTSEEKERNPKLRKDQTRMYPAFVTYLVRRPSTDMQGRTDLEGNTWDSEHKRFELWTETEPPDFSRIFGAPRGGNS
ncbi:MAG TPA: hypothetical protein V6D10_05805 [Trichocoleus sp.]|jgi:hypothetical protein